MEINQNEQPTQQELEEVFEYAANLLINQNKSPEETKVKLIEEGLDEEGADFVLNALSSQIKAKMDGAKKDMLYGALWCIGGIVATLAKIGFIFWGAIIFGAIQFLKGLANTGWLQGTIFQSDK